MRKLKQIQINFPQEVIVKQSSVGGSERAQAELAKPSIVSDQPTPTTQKQNKHYAKKIMAQNAKKSSERKLKGLPS